MEFLSFAACFCNQSRMELFQEAQVLIESIRLFVILGLEFFLKVEEDFL